MKSFLSSLLLLLFTLAAHAASGPIRVLFLGKEGTPAARHCATAMRELGRDAVWLEYTADPAQVTPEWIAHFDAVLVDAPQADFAALANVDAKRLVQGEFASEERDWADAGFIRSLRDRILAAVGDARRAEWQAFLAQREEEKREANPNVANYEKRPEPVSLQQPFSVKGSVERTQVAPDLRVELFASEPDIAKPIAMAWDERGRCWIAETSDYPHGVQPGGEGNDRIKICEDTDGDGKADKFTVFADKLNLPTSLVFARGGIIVSQPPSFLFLKDTDGDDKADVREVLMQGWGIKDTHAQASSLHPGFDNWIYGCVGYSGFKGTVGGKLHEFTMGTYRFKPDGSDLEFLHQFSNNSWGQSTNAAGDQFGGTANNAPIFYGGIPSAVCPPGMRVMTAKKINVEDKAHAITPNFRQVDVFGGYTAAAGSAFIYSANLPARLQGKAMVCEPTMKLISLMDVQPDGAGYVAKDAFNLVASSDEWMSPVFAEVGPDGAVWFADWQNFIIQHNPTPSVERGGYAAKTGVGGAHENPLRDHARGRIYRVVWENAFKPPQKTQERKKADWVAALGSDNQFWRLTAQRLLVNGERSTGILPVGGQGGAGVPPASLTGETPVPRLKALAAQTEGGAASIHALWTLQGLDALDNATHRAALSAKDPALRRNAIRAISADARGQALLFGAGVVSDPDPHTRLAALVKLAEFPTTPEVQTLVRGLASDPAVKADEWLAEAAKVLTKKHNAQRFREGPNLLPNPGFESTSIDGLPEGWKRRDYGNREGNERVKWETLTGPGDAHSGARGVRCITFADGDTSLFADVPLKPNTQYRLSGWVKTHALRGKVSLNLHGTRFETEKVTAGDSGWSEVETTFDSGNTPLASVNILHVANGDSYFDDVKLCELLPDADTDKMLTGNPARGETIVFKHQTAACVLCHMIKGQGSAVGPALDGIASRATPDYIEQSLIEPNKVLAKGYEVLGVSPMPPMNLVLQPQELADVKSYLQTLK